MSKNKISLMKSRNFYSKFEPLHWKKKRFEYAETFPRDALKKNILQCS